MARKKNKQDNIILLVLIGILVVCFIIICLLFYKYFYAGISETKYGDRLDGIEQHVLKDNLADEIKRIYIEDKTVGDIKVNVKGKVIYINMDFVESVKVETAQSQAIKALEAIGEENLKYYEVQYIITNKDNENFPIFGSKNANSLKVVW